MNSSTKIDPEIYNPETSVAWYCLHDQEGVWISLWMRVPHKTIGCEYINMYNLACSDVFNMEYEQADWRHMASFLIYVTWIQINSKRR